MTTDRETQHLTPELQRAVNELARAAAAYCNVSPDVKELARNGLAAALECGDATLTAEIGLLVSGIRSFRVIAHWPAAGIDQRELGRLELPPVYRA